MESLPQGLHQLSLEENPWQCDCRALQLKRWLLSTRIPLSAPVRCSRFFASPPSPLPAVPNNAEDEEDDDNESNSIWTPAADAESERGQAASSAYLDRLPVESFVCAPRAGSASSSGARNSSLLKSGPAANLASILAYLEPTLINGTSSGTGTDQQQQQQHGSKQATTKLVEAREGELTNEADRQIDTNKIRQTERSNR